MPVPAEGASGRETGRSGELVQRIASAAVLAPIGLAALFVGGACWDVVIAAAVGCLAYEWSDMGRRPAPVRAVLASLSMLVTLCGAVGWIGPAAACLAVGMAVLLVWPRAGAAISCGAAYVALPGVALVWLRTQPDGAAIVLLVMLTVWSSDTGAYAAGRWLGGPKLAPRVSPSKTWSGAIGGLAAACLVGAVFGAAHVVRMLHGMTETALVASVLGIASQAGDLGESWAKRRFGVKDSGRLIPGHGGLLDRVDGLMAAAPAAALLLLLT